MAKTQDPLRMLKAWLMHEGLTGAKFADQIGVTRATVSHWRTLRYRPGLYQALAIELRTGIEARLWLSEADQQRLDALAA